MIAQFIALGGTYIPEYLTGSMTFLRPNGATIWEATDCIYYPGVLEGIAKAWM